jgi:ureidoacrylate peracid hydrolase
MTLQPGSGESAGGYLPVAEYDLSRSALLVVDVTNDFGHPDGAYARHGQPCHPLDLIVPAVERLMTAMKAAGLPVILCSQVVITRSDGVPVGSPGLISARPWVREEGLRQGTWGTCILDGLPEPDIVVEKLRASGFHATPLDLVLRSLDVDTIVVVGGFTNQCVEATVRDGWALNYNVVLPGDGCAAFDPALHDATLTSLSPLAAEPAIDDLLQRLRVVPPVSAHEGRCRRESPAPPGH